MSPLSGQSRDRAQMMGVDPRRLMQVWAPGLARVSSGHLIGERLVLTAWHATADGVRDDGDDLEVRLFDPAGGSAWLTARRGWGGQGGGAAGRPAGGGAPGRVEA